MTEREKLSNQAHHTEAFFLWEDKEGNHRHTKVEEVLTYLKTPQNSAYIRIEGGELLDIWNLLIEQDFATSKTDACFQVELDSFNPELHALTVCGLGALEVLLGKLAFGISASALAAFINENCFE